MKNGKLFKLIAYLGPISEYLTQEIVTSSIKAILNKKDFTQCQKSHDYIVMLHNQLIQEVVNLINEDQDIRDSLKGNKLNCQKQFYQFPSEEYQSKQAQKIYKMGIMSFTLLSGCPPFEKANNSDPFYSLILEDNWYQFWQQHERKRADQFYSVNFKQFFQSCIFKNQKISFRDLLKQKWLSQQLTNGQQIKKQYQELIEQKEKVRAQAIAQQLERRKNCQDAKCFEPQRFREYEESQRFLEFFYQYKYGSFSLQETSIDILEDEPFCFMVDEEITLAAPIFANFVDKISAPIETIHQDVLGQGQPYEMKCQSLKSLSKSKFQIVLEYTYGTQSQELSNFIRIIIDMKSCHGNLVFVFSKESGNSLYFSQFFNLVKTRFEYCLKQ